MHLHDRVIWDFEKIFVFLPLLQNKMFTKFETDVDQKSIRYSQIVKQMLSLNRCLV
ncbi:hypothetical protein HanIR_Chr02g0084871 [Helianthus annuus]|nr:hypothetical protein HanIR_Chr02g0084871 [Helianthus annuus]